MPPVRTSSTGSSGWSRAPLTSRTLRKAIGPILSPGPELEMPGPSLSIRSGTRRGREHGEVGAVEAYLSGDPAGLIISRRPQVVSAYRMHTAWEVAEGHEGKGWQRLIPPRQRMAGGRHRRGDIRERPLSRNRSRRRCPRAPGGPLEGSRGQPRRGERQDRRLRPMESPRGQPRHG